MKQLEFMTEPEMHHLMHNMGIVIDEVCKIMNVEKPHFMLVLFNDPKIAQYISNCERKDVIEAMRVTANRLENQEDVTR